MVLGSKFCIRKIIMKKNTLVMQNMMLFMHQNQKKMILFHQALLDLKMGI